MGKRGFPAKRAREKVLTGQLPMTRENMGGAVVMPVRLVAPERLSEDQRCVWERTVELLMYGGTLGSVDAVILEAYCRAYVTWQKAEQDWDAHVKAKGSYVKAAIMRGSKSDAIIHPFVKAVRDARQEVVQLAIQLGMTPMSRLRMEQGAVGVVDKKVGVFQRLKDMRRASGCQKQA